mgnify:CR=1 FL=1
MYIGETGRKFEIRINEHPYAWEESSLGTTTVADHQIKTGHRFDPQKVILLRSGVNSFRKRISLENYKIISHKNDEDVTVFNNYIPDDNFTNKLQKHMNEHDV